MHLIPRSFFMDSVFDDFLTSKEPARYKCDIYEKDDNYYIEMDAPGFNKDDMKIEADKGYLTIALAKEETNHDEGKNYIRRERNVSEYQRSFFIGEVDPSKIKASFKDGAITVIVPKEAQIETKKTIMIE